VPHLAVLGATLLWSVVPVLTKVALEAFSPSFIALARLFQALLLVLLVRRPRGWRDVGVLSAWLAGLGLGTNYLFMAVGLLYTTASACNVVVQIEVVVLVVLARLFLNERLDAGKAVGMVLSVVGVGLVGWSGETVAALLASKYTLGNMLVAIAGLCWAAYALFQKKALARMQVAQSLVPVFAAASVSCIPGLLVQRAFVGQPGAQHWLALLVLGAPCTGLSYLLLAWGMRRIGASTTGLLTTMLPVFTLFEAHWFLGEAVTWYLGVGAALVVAGVAVISSTGRSS
jgi:drug/metabolite transporter (DMT)-like permease